MNYEKITKYFEDLDKDREEAIKISRDLIKVSTYSIIEVHKDNLEKAKQYLEESKKIKKNLDDLVNKNPDVKKFLDLIDIAYQEYVEANQFYSLIKENKILDQNELEVDVYTYVHGILDALGELKRKFFDYMIKKEIEKAKRIVNILEEMYFLLAPLSLYKYTNIRQKVDLTRKSIDELKSYLLKYV